jgi:NADH:ubiquinone oxidoreductase subunit H
VVVFLVVARTIVSSLLPVLTGVVQSYIQECAPKLNEYSHCPGPTSLDGVSLLLGRILWLMPVTVVLVLCVLAETNRAPFDFSEGESELVSGFNVEYGRVLFTLIFLATGFILRFFLLRLVRLIVQSAPKNLVTPTILLSVVFILLRIMLYYAVSNSLVLTTPDRKDTTRTRLNLE